MSCPRTVNRHCSQKNRARTTDAGNPPMLSTSPKQNAPPEKALPAGGRAYDTAARMQGCTETRLTTTPTPAPPTQQLPPLRQRRRHRGHHHGDQQLHGRKQRHGLHEASQGHGPGGARGRGGTPGLGDACRVCVVCGGGGGGASIHAGEPGEEGGEALQGRQPCGAALDPTGLKHSPLTINHTKLHQKIPNRLTQGTLTQAMHPQEGTGAKKRGTLTVRHGKAGHPPSSRPRATTPTALATAPLVCSRGTDEPPLGLGGQHNGGMADAQTHMHARAQRDGRQRS